MFLRKFYVVQDINNVPYKIVDFNQNALGAPIIKLSTLPRNDIPVEFVSPQMNFKLLLPFVYTRQFVNDLYTLRRLHSPPSLPYPSPDVVSVRFYMPNLNTPINANYDALINLLSNQWLGKNLWVQDSSGKNYRLEDIIEKLRYNMAVLNRQSQPILIKN